MINKSRNRSGLLCYQLAEQPTSKSRVEELEQIDLASHCAFRWPEHFGLQFHVANESKASPQYRGKLARMGLKKGVSDWLVLVPAHGRPYMVLELKRARKKDSTISKEQRDFLLSTESVGAFAVVAYGYRAALQAITDYFGGKC